MEHSVKLFRSVLFIAAISFSSHASAALQSYSFDATLKPYTEIDPDHVYREGAAVTGAFTYEDSIDPVGLPWTTEYWAYHGSLNGSIQVGNNTTISFENGGADVALHTWANSTWVTWYGGYESFTGGSISESNPPPRHDIKGIKLVFQFQGLVARNTPIEQIFATLSQTGSFSMLDYGDGDHSHSRAYWPEINSFVHHGPVEVPEPYSVLLFALGLMGMTAVRRQRR